MPPLIRQKPWLLIHSGHVSDRSICTSGLNPNGNIWRLLFRHAFENCKAYRLPRKWKIAWNSNFDDSNSFLGHNRSVLSEGSFSARIKIDVLCSFEVDESLLAICCSVRLFLWRKYYLYTAKHFKCFHLFERVSSVLIRKKLTIIPEMGSKFTQPLSFQPSRCCSESRFYR